MVGDIKKAASAKGEEVEQERWEKWLHTERTTEHRSCVELRPQNEVQSGFARGMAKPGMKRQCVLDRALGHTRDHLFPS